MNNILLSAFCDAHAAATKRGKPTKVADLIQGCIAWVGNNGLIMQKMNRGLVEL
jgi:hypothetical protein